MSEEKPVDESTDVGQNHFRETLLTTTEGRILLAGVALALGYIIWLGVRVLYAPWEAQALVGMTATMAVFGQAPGLAFGYSFGLGHATVILICMIIETVCVLIFYPLFVFSWRHLLVIKRLKKTFDRVHVAAERHRHTIQKYGVIGLFFFVWFPFWMTGAMVGCVIGFLLELPAWLNLTAVLGGAYMAIFSWALFMHYFHQRAAAYGSYAPAALLVGLIAIVVIGHFLQRTLHERRNRNHGE